jgi:hypothetical protein
VGAPGSPPVVSFGVPSPQGAPLSGSFKLQIGGVWTAPIPFDASSAALEAAVSAANPAYRIQVRVVCVTVYAWLCGVYQPR